MMGLMVAGLFKSQSYRLQSSIKVDVTIVHITHSGKKKSSLLVI